MATETNELNFCELKFKHYNREDCAGCPHDKYTPDDKVPPRGEHETEFEYAQRLGLSL